MQGPGGHDDSLLELRLAVHAPADHAHDVGRVVVLRRVAVHEDLGATLSELTVVAGVCARASAPPPAGSRQQAAGDSHQMYLASYK
eukprot:COSAG01_NODE_5380_length_4295_cov_312.910867_6_plen_86_part_00